MNHPEYTFTRKYRGKVRGVVLDWSGTTADAYVIAPAIVFAAVFKKHGVEISMSEARGPMGLRKDLHIKALTEVPAIRDRWRDAHGSYPDQSDVDALFKDFVPMQLECLPTYAALLPGVVEMADKLQNEYGIKIVMSTGSNVFQAYWFASGASRMLSLFLFVYRVDSGDWVPMDAAFLATPDLHRTAPYTS